MSCRDYILFRSCDRQNCERAHDFLYCGLRCGSNVCKRFHLTAEEMQGVKDNTRPFSQKVQLEVDRLAYVYRLMYEEPALVCTRLLTGMRRCALECTVCTQLDHPSVLPPRCSRCGMYGGDMFLPKCHHIYHRQCSEFMPVDLTQALPQVKCLECREVQLPPEKLHWV